MRALKIISAAAFSCILVACQNQSESKIVAEKFLKAYSEGKFQEAKQYATGRTQRMVELAGAISLQGPKRQKPAEYVILECKEIGDHAVVKYRTRGSLTNEVIYLVKKDETWLVGAEE